MSEDREYQKWLKTFYEGSFLVKGWNDRKKDLLRSMVEQKDAAGKLLDELGKLISEEWAKDNDIRKIDTDDIRRWGDQLQKARDESEKKLVAEIKNIKKEASERLKETKA